MAIAPDNTELDPMTRQIQPSSRKDSISVVKRRPQSANNRRVIGLSSTKSLVAPSVAATAVADDSTSNAGNYVERGPAPLTNLSAATVVEEKTVVNTTTTSTSELKDVGSRHEDTSLDQEKLTTSSNATEDRNVVEKVQIYTKPKVQPRRAVVRRHVSDIVKNRTLRHWSTNTDDTSTNSTTKVNDVLQKPDVTCSLPVSADAAHDQKQFPNENKEDKDLDCSEDEGIYDETFRFSVYKFVGNNLPSPREVTAADDVVTSTSKEAVVKCSPVSGVSCVPDGATGETDVLQQRDVSSGNGGCAGEKMSQSASASEVRSKPSFTKTVQRQCTVMTYSTVADANYRVERIMTLRRGQSGGNYGFHMANSTPVVITTIEPGSPADVAGVQVGDRLLTVNNVNVAAMSLPDVLNLVISDPACVQLGVTAGAMSRDTPLLAGYLCRYESRVLAAFKTWKKRWVQLKYDGFLYIYRNQEDGEPMGAISLMNCIVHRAPGFDGRDHVFKLVKYSRKLETSYFQCQAEDDVISWAASINTVVSRRKTPDIVDVGPDVSSHNVDVAAMSIKNPDCYGFLTKAGNHYQTWRRRYCVFKNACLYYFTESTSTTAKGVAHLQGYRVEDDTVNRRFGFNLIPPIDSMRLFRLTADNETDMRRWMSSLTTSIGKWIAVSVER